MDFLNEYKVTSLAIAFIIGVAATTLIQSLVNNVVMPIIAPLITPGEWQAATFTVGPIKIAWGAFLSSAINFIIIALVVFLIGKSLLRKGKERKAKK